MDVVMTAPRRATAPRSLGSSWQGGEVEQLGLTRADAVPAAGYGLYVYELPGNLVSQDTLAVLEEFDCSALYRAQPAALGQSTKALMLLPVISSATQPELVDLALSRDFLRVTIGAENPRLIYIAITGIPITNPGGAPKTDIPWTIITIPPQIGPHYIAAWLSELLVDIENGDVASPEAFGLEFSSLLYEIGSVGGIAHLWIQPADAVTPPSCS